MVIHVVRQGDTTSSIAAQYGVSPSVLIYDNQLDQPDRLVIGQALLIPTSQNMQEKLGTLSVNGYAYPFIERYTLTETLPFLTSLSVFSYGFTPEGNLIPPVNDQWMLDLARQYGVESVLVLTPFTESGTFNNQLVSLAVTNPQVQEQLISELLETALARGFSTVDVDFEFVLAEDRIPFADFVGRLTTRMNAAGIQVTVALAPKISSDQPGLLYEGIDYALLGANANRVLLMTYEWGYTYGPPMAVAPIPNVRRVLDYAVTQIPPSKIDMGIPNYGYDWPLPFERGVTMARTVGNVEAVRIARENNAVIQFDETAKSPFFTYFLNGTEHVVWFEDVRSIYAKLLLAKEYGFHGVGYWQIMKLFRANWLLLQQLFYIR